VFRVTLTWNYINTEKREGKEKSIPLSTFGYSERDLFDSHLQERHSVFSTKVDEFNIFHPVVEEDA
jgi:hypothetical protein